MSETKQMGFFRVWSIINTGAKNIICKVFCMLYHWVKISPILNLFTNVKSLGAKTSTEQMMRECRLMQNDTEEKEMHAYDDTKPVEANSCMSALV